MVPWYSPIDSTSGRDDCYILYIDIYWKRIWTKFGPKKKEGKSEGENGPKCIKNKDKSRGYRLRHTPKQKVTSIHT